MKLEEIFLFELFMDEDFFSGFSLIARKLIEDFLTYLKIAVISCLSA